jgi:hypothetical protein
VVVYSRREKGAISGVGYKRPSLLADEGPASVSGNALIADADPI